MSEPLDILVIEDRPADFLMVERHLKQQGLSVRCVRVDSLEGLKEAITAESWDLVLADYNVPQLNFLDGLTLILAAIPDVPVLLLSGSVGEEKAVELLKQGVCDFVLKENLARLVPAVERCLKDAEVRREGREAVKDLHRRASERLHAQVPVEQQIRAEFVTQRELHEFQVQQVELEIQNEELRRTRDEVEALLDKYTDLYDFAPAGYLTLDQNGDIRAANLSGVELLGFEHSRLPGRRFALSMPEENRPAFTAFLGAVFASRGKQVCETVLLRNGNPPLFVQIEALAGASGQECRLALIDITGRKRAEDDLRSCAIRLINMEEGLRKKLATELHDEIGRDLTVLGMNLAIIRDSLNNAEPQKIVERIEDSGRLIEAISRTVRTIMSMLRPPVLDDYGLPAALRWHSDLFTKRTGITVTIQVDDPFPRLPEEKEMGLFRIVQEALMNAAKHAAAREVSISIRIDTGLLRLTILDDGTGFTSSSSTPVPGVSGLGLKIIRERAESIGGTFSLDSAPGKGTAVSVEIPLEDE